MRKISRICSSLLALLLVFSLTPTGAFADEDSVSHDGFQVDLAGDAELQSSAEDEASETGEFADSSMSYAETEASDGSTVIGVENSEALAYVYIEHPMLELGEAQHIAIGLLDEDLLAEEAVLVVTSTSSGECLRVSLSNSVEGAVLFEIRPECLAADAYRLDSVEINGSPAIMLNEESYEFIVTKVVSDSSSEDTDEVVEGVETNAIAVDSNGDVVASGSFSKTLDATAGGEISMLSASGRLATKIPSASSPLIVVLDPGHGGYDGGAGGYGVQEDEINLKIAQYCREELEKYLYVEVYMTRENDSYVSLGERVDFAVACNADLVVSIHNNSSVSSGPHGSEVIIPNNSSWYFNETHGVGLELGQKILSQLTSLGLSVSQGVYWRDCTNNEPYADGSLSDYYTLIAGPRESGILGIIVEHAFVSNPNDAAFLASEENLKALGIADAKAIAEQYGLRLKMPMYGFSDVFEETPHYQEIGWLAASGISTGFSDGTFKPLNDVTRQDMAAFLYRFAGSPSYTPSASDLARFPDVDESTPHYKEILWLASTGISEGFPDGEFKPGSSVARQDAAAFLRRFTALHLDPAASSWDPTLQDTAAFSDVIATTPHAEDIWWLASLGIAGGFADGSFRGENVVVRQDMAAFLYRLSNISSFQASEEEKRAFSDVDESTVHCDEVWWLAASGISTGFSDGTFKPLNDVTRQDMAAFLYRFAGSPSYTPSASDLARFPDVDESTPHYKEILWLASTGISEGFPDGEFKPGSSVMREDMAAFLRRTYDFLSDGGSSKWEANSSMSKHFFDVNSSTWHAGDIWWLASMGISLGFSDGSYGVGRSVARGDMAAFLFRLRARIDRMVPIMGETEVTAAQLVLYFKSAGGVYPDAVYKDKGADSIEDFASIVVEESLKEGVRAEVVFCQAMHETGWLRFGGDVQAEQCNFAGLGATGGGVGGGAFEDVRTGIRAQVQHLKAYASTDPLVNKCVDPRFDYVDRGSAPYLTDLNGKWAVPGTIYGQKIAAMIDELMSIR